MSAEWHFKAGRTDNIAPVGNQTKKAISWHFCKQAAESGVLESYEKTDRGNSLIPPQVTIYAQTTNTTFSLLIYKKLYIFGNIAKD